MIEVLVLCSCACITTCLWCAVTALTCPRIVNVNSGQCDEELQGICQSSSPLKFHYVKKWSELDNPQILPRSYCPNISYPILMCPIEYPLQNYQQSEFISNSSSSQPTNPAVSSTSNSISKKSETSSRVEKMKKLSPSNIERESNSEQALNFGNEDFGHSPIPPPRHRRNRDKKSLKSMMKSKFKIRYPAEFKNQSVSRSAQYPADKKSDKETKTDFLQPTEDPISGRKTQFHCLRKLFRVSRSGRSPSGSDKFKYQRCSRSATRVPVKNLFLPENFNNFNHTNSNMIFVPFYNPCNEIIFCRDQSTCIFDEDYDPEIKLSRRRKNRKYDERKTLSKNFEYEKLSKKKVN